MLPLKIFPSSRPWFVPKNVLRGGLLPVFNAEASDSEPSVRDYIEIMSFLEYGSVDNFPDDADANRSGGSAGAAS